MKILYTSNWRLGLSLNGNDQLDKQTQAIKEFEKTILEKHADAVVITGNIFSGIIPIDEALELFGEFAEFMYKNKKQLIVLLGKNDSKSISFLSRVLKSSGIYFVNEPSKIKLIDSTLYLIPYMSLNEFKKYYNEDFKNLDEAYKYVIDDFNISGNNELLISYNKINIDNAPQINNDEIGIIDTKSGKKEELILSYIPNMEITYPKLEDMIDDQKAIRKKEMISKNNLIELFQEFAMDASDIRLSEEEKKLASNFLKGGLK